VQDARKNGLPHKAIGFAWAERKSQVPNIETKPPSSPCQRRAKVCRLCLTVLAAISVAVQPRSAPLPDKSRRSDKIAPSPLPASS